MSQVARVLSPNLPIVLTVVMLAVVGISWAGVQGSDHDLALQLDGFLMTNT